MNTLPIDEDDLSAAIERQNFHDIIVPGLRIDHILSGEIETEPVERDEETEWLLTEELLSSAEEYTDSYYPVCDFSNPPEELVRLVEKVMTSEYKDDTRAGADFGEMVDKVSQLVDDPYAEGVDTASPGYMVVSELNREVVEAIRKDFKKDAETNINFFVSPTNIDQTLSYISDIPEELTAEDDWVLLKTEDDSETDYLFDIAFHGPKNAFTYQIKELLHEFEGRYNFKAGFYQEADLI